MAILLYLMVVILNSGPEGPEVLRHRMGMGVGVEWRGEEESAGGHVFLEKVG